MSTLPLSVTRLAEVRETMRSAAYWTEELTKETPLWFCETFMGRTGYYKHNEKKVLEKATEFVHLAYIFNAIAYFNGEHARGKSEPTEWQYAVQVIDKINCKRLKICQFLKSLQCIRYNTDVRGWLRSDEYEKWERKEQYENFHNTLDGMIYHLALHILDYDSEDYKNAKWE